MPHRRQYEQLSQFERGRIIGMMKAGWSARRVARQLGCSDCVVRRCWDQWIREMSFTRRSGSGHPRLTSRRKDRHLVRNARVQPTASSAAIQALIAPPLEAPVSSRTMRRCLAEGHLGSRRPLRPPIDASVWSDATHEETGLQGNGAGSLLATRRILIQS
ncbi:HTH_Tnp_Tc3_2 domain-containing protein [Trichonephila clavipes]|nr:HTH_Tnp_Tc3_2 domain-containing protein [Trichonephila clavipes]